MADVVVHVSYEQHLRPDIYTHTNLTEAITLLCLHRHDPCTHKNMLQYCVEFLKNVYCIAYYKTIIAPYSLLVNYFVQKSNMVPPPGYDPGSSDFQSVAMTTSAKAG